MADLDINIDMKRFNKLSLLLPDAVEKEARFGLWEFVAEFKKDFAKSNLQDNWKNKTRTHLAKRSGDLLRSFDVGVDGKEIDDVQAFAKIGGTQTSAYAPIQERGGIIRAKKSKYLAIPVQDRKTGKYHALTAGGRAKWLSIRAQNLDLLIRKKNGKKYLYLGYSKKRQLADIEKRRAAGRNKPRKPRKPRGPRKPRSSGPRKPRGAPRRPSKPKRTPKVVRDIFIYRLKESVRIRGRMGFADGFHKHWTKNGPDTLRRITDRIIDSLM